MRMSYHKPVHKPVHMAKEDLLYAIDEIRAAIEANDSWEGHFSYNFPEDDAPINTDFAVRAVYRIGNSMGQGGMRVIGEFINEPEASETGNETILENPEGRDPVRKDI